MYGTHIGTVMINKTKEFMLQRRQGQIKKEILKFKWHEDCH